MINNRLFKKINSIFWGILTWLPIVLAILFCFKTQIPLWQEGVTPNDYFYSCLDAIFNSFSEMNDAYLTNPLTAYFIDFIELFYDDGYPIICDFLCSVSAWVCWVQVMRLLVYAFYWFIDLISGLFDLMTFNRKGDN